MTDQSETAKQSKVEVPDILLILGLVLFFVGLGFAISWPWALVLTGAVLIGLSIWMVEPRVIRKGKAD